MVIQSNERLPDAFRIALANTPVPLRDRLEAAFRLDQRLARIVARTTELMLGQMRLAWWRDVLAKPVGERPRGDVVLDGLGAHWSGCEAALIAMVDGWELLVTAQSLGPAQIAAFGEQRGAFFGALVNDCTPAQAERVAAAAFRWALADAATAVSDAAEQALLIEAGLARKGGGGRLPKPLRGLAVLDALALRALRRGGRPLLEGRGAPIAAMRAAIFLT